MDANVKWTGTARKVKGAVLATAATATAMTSAQDLAVSFLTNLVIAFEMAPAQLAGLYAEGAYGLLTVAVPTLAAMAGGYFTPEPRRSIDWAA